MPILSVLLILIIIQTLAWGQFEPNPCPNYFQYIRDGSEIYGLIEVPPIQLGQSLKLNVQLSVRARLQNNYGTLEIVGSKEAALQKVLKGQNLQYRVVFPTQNPLPKLNKIVYNGQEICSMTAESQGVTTIQLEHTFLTYTQTQHVPVNNVPNSPGSNSNMQWPNFVHGPEMQISPTNGEDNIKWQYFIGEPGQPMRPIVVPNTTPTVIAPTRAPNQRPLITNDNNDDCGITTPAGNPLIYNGSPTTKGEFPWLVVMYVKKTRNLEFQCGGTLISEQIVVTAAHCIHLPDDNKLTKNDIVLHVGRFDLDDWTDSVSPKIQNIFVHQDYKRHSAASYDADIAVITTIKKIEFTQFIRPICLWRGKSPSASQMGTVVGWGRDETGVATSKPNKIEMPVVSNQTCLDSEPTYQYITSDRTFCAGRRDTGVAPCNGDSGGGFVMKVNGLWYLRGIVSIGLYDKDTRACDVRNYSVFTDVAKFLSWIDLYL